MKVVAGPRVIIPDGESFRSVPPIYTITCSRDELRTLIVSLAHAVDTLEGTDVRWVQKAQKLKDILYPVERGK